jgi:hypothetical protein
MSEGVHDAFLAGLDTTPRLPRDAVTVALGQRYAETLDDLFDMLTSGEAAEDGAAHARVILEITRIGARLEAVADKLGMAPGARPAADPKGGAGVDPASVALDNLRTDAAAGYPAAGIDYAAGVDPAVTEADAAD